MPRRVSQTVIAPDGTPLAWHAHQQGAERPRGPAVVLTNGIGTTENFWRHLVEGLAADHHVAHWDYRGHGQSGLSRSGRYDLEVQAEDLARVSAAVMADGDGQAPVQVAFSMGVAVLFELYRSRPELVRGMVLIAGAPDAPGEGTGLFRVPGAMALARAAVAALTPVVPVVAPVARLLLRSPLLYPAARALGVLQPGAPKEDIDLFLGQLAQMDPRAYWLTLRGLMRAHASDVLARVRVPVLIIAAARDPFMRLSQMSRMREALPGAEYLEFADAGHAGLLEAGPQIATAVRRLIARVGSPG